MNTWIESSLILSGVICGLWAQLATTPTIITKVPRLITGSPPWNTHQQQVSSFALEYQKSLSEMHDIWYCGTVHAPTLPYTHYSQWTRLTDCYSGISCKIQTTPDNGIVDRDFCSVFLSKERKNLQWDIRQQTWPKTKRKEEISTYCVPVTRMRVWYWCLMISQNPPPDLCKHSIPASNATMQRERKRERETLWDSSQDTSTGLAWARRWRAALSGSAPSFPFLRALSRLTLLLAPSHLRIKERARGIGVRAQARACKGGKTSWVDHLI